jgi:PAS domain S-box-containing protein
MVPRPALRPRLRRLVLPLRSHLVFLSLVTLVPMLVFGFMMTAIVHRQELDALETNQVRAARAVAAAVDQEVGGLIAAMEAVAASSLVDAGDFAAFYRYCVEVTRELGWENLGVADRSGRLLFSVIQPYGTPLPSIADRDYFRRVLLTGQPVVSDVLRAEPAGHPAIVAAVPVRRQRQLRYVLYTTVRPERIRAVLAAQRYPSDWTVTLVDRAGNVVARSVGHEKATGQPADTALLAAIQEGEGPLRRAVEVDGTRAYVAYSRLGLTEWTASVGIPADPIDASLRQSLLIVSGAGALFALLAVGMALVVGRGVVQPMRELTRSAEAVGRGELAPSLSSTVSEVDSAARAMGRAAQLLAERAAARDRVEGSLRARERDLRLITDALPVLVSYVDAEERCRFTNRTCQEWFGRTRAEIDGRHIREVLGDAAYQIVRPHAATALAGREVRFEATIPFPQGGRRIVEATLVPDIAEEGAVRGYVGLMADVTERARREAERAELLARAETARLETELARARIKFLAEASSLLSSSLDYETTLSRIAWLAVPFLADWCTVDILEDGGTLRRLPVAHADPADADLARRLQAYPLDPRTDPRAEILRTGVGEIAEDVTDPGRVQLARDDQHAQVLRAVGARALVSVPLVARGRIIGAMSCLATRPERRYGPADLALAEDLARRAALALENARLYRHSEVQRRRAEALADVGRVLLQSVDPDRVGQRIADHARALFRVTNAILYRLDPTSGDLMSLAVAGDVGPGTGSGIRIRSGEGIAGLAVRERQVVATADVLADERITMGPELRRQVEAAPFRAVLAVPLRARDAVIGVFALGDRRGRVFDADEIGLAESFADQASLALENAALFAREQAARGDAETANRVKDEFLATLSHELRTPLTSILGWARTLRVRKLDEAMSTRALEAIERNARAQAQLVDDLLDVSRIITGKLRLEVQPVELHPVVEAALDAVSPAADAKNIQLDLDVDPDAGVIVGDANRLQQIVWNLLSNAVKFTPAGGSVAVAVRGVGSEVEIVVRDSGRGIDAGFLPYIFDRFRQADSGTTRTHGGLGLGLAIVRHLAEMHGGSVAATSPGKGQGATFTVRLPRASATPRAVERRGDPATASAAAADSAPVRLDGTRVLVVDDEPDTRELVGVVLEQCGAKVATASSVHEALGVLSWFDADVLVADIAMPLEDGHALIRKVRELGPGRAHLPAVALTAHARSEDRERALASGFQVHLAKPVSPETLTQVVADLARRR